MASQEKFQKLIDELNQWVAEHQGKHASMEEFGELQRLLHVISGESLAWYMKGIGQAPRNEWEHRG